MRRSAHGAFAASRADGEAYRHPRGQNPEKEIPAISIEHTHARAEQAGDDEKEKGMPFLAARGSRTKMTHA